MTDPRITITITGTKGKGYDTGQLWRALHALGVEEPTITEEAGGFVFAGETVTADSYPDAFAAYNAALDEGKSEEDARGEAEVARSREAEPGDVLTDDQLVLIMTRFPNTIAQFDPDVVDRVRDRLPQEATA